MSDIPNIVFIISDHHRFDYMGCGGAEFIHTPNLDALAARGTRVDGMYSTTPLCVPQRIAITAGRYPHNTGCFSNRHPVNPSIPTFLHQLRGVGVHTAMIGKLHHHVHVLDANFIGHESDIRRLGYDTAHETSGKQGVSTIRCHCRYAEFLQSKGLLEPYRKWTGTWGSKRAVNEPWPFSDETTQDAYIARKAIEFIEHAPKDQPFYLHLGFVGPHPQFDAPQRFREFYRDAIPPSAVGHVSEGAHQPAPGSKTSQFPEPDHEDERSRVETWRAFAACITEVDHYIGKVILALEESGHADNTIILYTSDHGEMMGDHGRNGKGVFYEPSIHVPLIAAGPGIPVNRKVEALAELIDIGKTVCDFQNAESHHFDQGVSMRPALTGFAETCREDVFAEMGSDKMLFDGRYKLMYGDLVHDTRREYQESPYHGPAFGRPVNLPPDRLSLYDLKNDPDETRNLAEEAGGAELLETMKTKLLNRLIANMQAVPEDSGSVM